MQSFSRVTGVICELKRRLHDAPSMQMAYLAAIAAEGGSADELRFLLRAAYKRFYMRRSWLEGYLGVRSGRLQQWVNQMDDRVSARHARDGIAVMSRAVVC